MQVLASVLEQIKKSKNEYYVYRLKKSDGVDFYIGKGKVKTNRVQRVAVHEYEAKTDGKNLLKINTIRKMWDNGDIVYYEIDSWFDYEKAALCREKELIAKLGRIITKDGILTNLTDGGDGQTQPPEVRQRISDSLKEYYAKNPDALNEMSERATQYYENNPIAIEDARQNAIKNKSHEALDKWREEHPDLQDKKQAEHSGRMLKWHEENREFTKEIAAKRNEKFRTDEHREYMRQKSQEYVQNNPQATAARLAQVAETNAKKAEIWQECLSQIRDWLIKEGKITDKWIGKEVTNKQLHKWKSKGFIPFEMPNGFSNIEVIETFRKELHGRLESTRVEGTSDSTI